MRAEYDRSTALPDEATADLFRSAMRNLAGGVAVITAGTGGDRTGLTVTSLTSLSVEPPTILVCVRQASPTLATIAATRAFGVSVLSDDQRTIAERFSGRGGVTGAARYSGAHWRTLITGAPLLDDALSILDCSLAELFEWHSHAIVIGRVRAIRASTTVGKGPLIYWRGNYDSVPDAASLALADADPDDWY